MPLPFVWTLQITRAQRLAVTAVFLVGALYVFTPKFDSVALFPFFILTPSLKRNRRLHHPPRHLVTAQAHRSNLFVSPLPSSLPLQNSTTLLTNSVPSPQGTSSPASSGTSWNPTSPSSPPASPPCARSSGSSSRVPCRHRYWTRARELRVGLRGIDGEARGITAMGRTGVSAWVEMGVLVGSG